MSNTYSYFERTAGNDYNNAADFNQLNKNIASIIATSGTAAPPITLTELSGGIDGVVDGYSFELLPSTINVDTSAVNIFSYLIPTTAIYEICSTLTFTNNRSTSTGARSNTAMIYQDTTLLVTARDFMADVATGAEFSSPVVSYMGSFTAGETMYIKAQAGASSVFSVSPVSSLIVKRYSGTIAAL